MNVLRLFVVLIAFLGLSERAFAVCTSTPGSYGAHCTTSMEAAAWPSAHLRPVGFYQPYCRRESPPQYGSTYRDPAPSNRYVVYVQCGVPGTPENKYSIASAATFEVDCPYGHRPEAGADPRCL